MQKRQRYEKSCKRRGVITAHSSPQIMFAVTDSTKHSPGIHWIKGWLRHRGMLDTAEINWKLQSYMS